jgi:hypothetical protein
LDGVKRIDLKKTASFYQFRTLDVILIILILFITAGVVLNTKLAMNWALSSASEASVFREGKQIAHLSLDKDREIPLLDGKVRLEVKEKRIRVKKSNCPRQVCVHMGWIRYPGQTIACVPYGILIEIKPSDSPVVDAVVY